MPAGIVKTDRDERLWTEAKKRAAEEGRTKDYAYIMGIFKRMKGMGKASSSSDTLHKADDSKTKAPSGFAPIANSRHGGFHKKQGKGYIYWYPGIGVTSDAHAGDKGKPGAPAGPASAPQGSILEQIKRNPGMGKQESPSGGSPAGKEPPPRNQNPAAQPTSNGATKPASAAPSAAGGAKPGVAAQAPAAAPKAPPAAPGAAAPGKVITDPKALPPEFNKLDKVTRAAMTADWDVVQKEMEKRFGKPEPYKGGDLKKSIGEHLDKLGAEGYIIPSNVEKAKEMLGKMVEHGKAAGFDEEKLSAVMEENVRKLGQQEMESARRTLGDHGVRHLSSNARMSDAIFDTLEKGGQKIDSSDKFMAYQVWLDHDMGYTIPAIAQGGFAVADNYHPQASAVLVMQQKKKYEDLFGADKFDQYVQAVANHSGTAVDWKGDHFGSAVRLADNTHLFADKMPEVLFDRPSAVEALVKIRLAQELIPKDAAGDRDPAAKAKFKALVGSVKKGLVDEINKRTDLPPPSKAALIEATQELGEMTPKFLISRLAGRSPEFKFSNGDMNCTIAQSDARQTIGEVFGEDEEDKQFQKLLKDYGTDPKKILAGTPPPEAHIGDKGNGINFKWEEGTAHGDPAEAMHTKIMKTVRGKFEEIQKMGKGAEQDKALDEFFGAKVAKALRALTSLTSDLDDWLEKAEKIPGGLAAGKKPADFDADQLAAGMKVEAEHSPDAKIQREIAMDHLTEDRDYYRKLARMEAKKGGSETGLSDAEIKTKVTAFLRENPKPEDHAVHELAADLGVNKHRLEEMIYELLGSKLGKSSGGPYIGPRGGKWADAAHTVAWKEGQEPEKKDPAAQWKDAAQKLLGASKHEGQEGLHYRSYLRAIIAGQPSQHLTDQFEGARTARSDLIDEWGRLGKSAMTAVAARTGAERPSVAKPLPSKGPGLLQRISAKLGHRPPGGGWSPIPGGKKGGFRKMGAGGYTYWYPGMKPEGGTQKEAEAHVAGKEKEAKVEEAKKQILHHEKRSAHWGETASRRHQQGAHPAEVSRARDRMHHHAAEAGKLREEHGLKNWGMKWSRDDQTDILKGKKKEAPALEKTLLPDPKNRGEQHRRHGGFQPVKAAPVHTAPPAYREPQAKKLPEANKSRGKDEEKMDTKKSVRMGSVDLGLSSDEMVARSLENGMELGIMPRHHDQQRKLNVEMMAKGTIYQGEAALPDQAGYREQYMREQILANTVEDDPSGNQGQGGDPAWFGFQQAATPETQVIDDTDPSVRSAFRKRD